MRRLVVPAAALLLLLVACDPLTRPPGTAPLRYRDAVFTGVNKTTDITYGTANDINNQPVTLKLDLYQPNSDKVTRRPAIVWVHGGSFDSGDKTSPELVDEATTFAMKGYVNVSINYRLVPGGCSATQGGSNCVTGIREAEQDAQAAVRFLRSQATTYGIDPTRIAVGGSSAGAITALNVAFGSEDAPVGSHQGFSQSVRAAQSISGANLLTDIGPGDAPTLLFHGTADPLVPYSWAQSTVTNAQNAGLVSILRSWPGQGHVPYAQNRQQILDETTNFFFWMMDLTHAAH